MAILNVGSVNIDNVYRVARLPGPGETLAARSYSRGLGGKGANMSLAAAAGGGRVLHCGAVGADGGWCAEALAKAGVDVESLVTVSGATGHAVICVDDAGENMIVIHPGANRMLTRELIDDALARIRGGWLLLQNETNLCVHAAEAARARGLNVAYAAAPFEADAAAAMLPLCDLLAVNAVEAAQLAAHLGAEPMVPQLLVTRGAEGAIWQGHGQRVEVGAFPVTPLDTTGAGDTFLGFFLAGLDLGRDPEAALRRAAAAAALQVMRPGAAEAIPTADEVEAFLDGGPR